MIEKFHIFQAKFDDLNGAHKNVLKELASTNKAIEDSNKLVVLHPSTIILDHMLTLGKASHDHRGLSFNDCSTNAFKPSINNSCLAKEQVVIDLIAKGKNPLIVTPRHSQRESIMTKTKISECACVLDLWSERTYFPCLLMIIGVGIDYSYDPFVPNTNSKN